MKLSNKRINNALFDSFEYLINRKINDSLNITLWVTLKQLFRDPLYVCTISDLALENNTNLYKYTSTKNNK